MLGLAGSASAQQRMSGGQGASGGFTGGSGSSGSFGSSGSSSGSGSGFTGGTTFGSTGSSGRGGSGTASYGQSSPYGTFYANPFALGLVSSGSSASSSSAGSRYVRPYPVQLSFGQPLYNTTGTTGTASISRGGLGGASGFGSGSTSTSTFPGVSSQGIRRAPSYLVETAIDEPPARARAQTIRADLQSVIAGSSRLPSRGNIRVTTDANGAVILRGRVRDDRERRMAESLVRLTPGVYRVRNELRVPIASRR